MRQNYRGGHDGPSERRHAGFINTGDKPEALLPKLNLKTQQVVKALALGAVFSPTLANLFGEMMSALAFVCFQGFDQAFRNRTRAIDKALP